MQYLLIAMFLAYFMSIAVAKLRVFKKYYPVIAFAWMLIGLLLSVNYITLEIVNPVVVRLILIDALTVICFFIIEWFNSYYWTKKLSKGYVKRVDKYSLPVQTFVFSSMRGREFLLRKEKFIKQKDIRAIRDKLEPGDILMKRNDWQLLNIGIRDFFTHTGIYLGTERELSQYFNKQLGGKSFSSFLKKHDYEKYRNYKRIRGPKIIESIYGGVQVKPLNNIAQVDYFAALRPNVNKEDKFESLLNAISFLGSPYDYNFDFEDDTSFICSEVIYKSYKEYLNFEPITFVGRKVIRPSYFAKKFKDERMGKDPDLKFVLFYNYSYKLNRAVESDENAFAEVLEKRFKYKRERLKHFKTMIT